MILVFFSCMVLGKYVIFLSVGLILSVDVNICCVFLYRVVGRDRVIERERGLLVVKLYISVSGFYYCDEYYFILWLVFLWSICCLFWDKEDI